MQVIDRPNEAVVCVTMDLYTAPKVYTSLVSYTQLVAHFLAPQLVNFVDPVLWAAKTTKVLPNGIA